MRFLDLGVLLVEVGPDAATPGDSGIGPVSAGGRRPAALLSTLLMYLNRRVSVDTLLDAIWGDAVSAGSASTLESHIWRLRRLLEPGRARGQPASVLINDSGGYRLVATPDQVDSARFEQLALDVVDLLTTGQPGRALRAADEALALWRGVPFDEIADRSWALGTVARLTEVHVQVQERRVDAVLAVGRPDQALSDLESLLADHPLRERFWWQRMLALFRSGRVDEALRGYATVRETLLDELGMDPGPELQELHQRILQQDPTLELAAPTPQPAAIRRSEVRLPRSRRLIGREHDQDELVAQLRRTRLVTITGPAGAGKTGLAIEVARVASDGYPDGTWFVDLSAVEDPEAVAPAIVAVLELATPTTSSARAALVRFARDHQALFVLDNCEQILDTVAELAEQLTEPGSEVAVLTTSREPLRLADEAVWWLDALPVGTTDESADPYAVPAVALFLERDRSAGGRSDRPEDELDVILRICRAVDGNPLAIELAAALTAAYSLDEIADQVQRDPGRLATIGRGQARHHQTLHAAIERSYRLLPPEEQLLHRRLAVLPAGFSRELAESVAGPGIDGWSVGGLLARLVHRSLLTVTNDGRAHFSQLATIRGHAGHALASTGELADAERLRDLWTSSLLRGRPLSGRPEEADFYARVRANLPTIRASLHRQLEVERTTLGQTYVADLLGYWYYHGMEDEARRWSELAVRPTDPQDAGATPRPTPATEVRARLTLVNVLLHQGLADRARSEFALVGPQLDAAVAEQPRAVAEIMLAAASTFSLTHDLASMRTGLDHARAIEATRLDPDLVVIEEAISCLAETVAGPSAEIAARAERNFEAASAVGNLWAAWASCSSINAAALVARDAATGLVWSRRLISLQDQLGARTVLTHLETYGDFLVLDGRLIEATRVFSATHQAARRGGAGWPHNHLTVELLDHLRRELPTAEFDRAWALGPTLNRRELIDS